MTAQDVLDFWFLPAGVPRPQWFRKDDAFDATIRTRFGPTLEQAVAGGEVLAELPFLLADLGLH